MKKSRFPATAMTLGLAVAATSAIAALGGVTMLGASADTKDYHLTLDATNAPTEVSYEAFTDELHNPVSFEVSGLTAVQDAHVGFLEGGTLHNVTAITGLQGLTLFGEGDFEVAYGATAERLSTPYTLTIGEEFIFEEGLNFMEISNAGSGTATIERAVFRYSCTYVEPIEGTARLEAEDYSHSLTTAYNGDERASGGAYVGAIDNGGQGLQFEYFAYHAGKRELTVAYATGNPGSFHTLYVNYEPSGTVDYPENTGWIGDNGGVTATAKAEIELVKGWNTIHLVKDGDGSNNYGGYAQVDYIEISGSGLPYDPADYEVRTEYVYEGEMGYLHTSGAPFADANNQLRYSAGEINATGQGVDFENLRLPAGRYSVQAAIASDGPRTVSFRVDEEAPVMVEIEEGYGFNQHRLTNAFEVDLGLGTHEVAVTRPENGNWFCLDYLKLTKIG